jgi:D-glycero-D-manno-heptose 1,7-bisphosphate phosphatase
VIGDEQDVEGAGQAAVFLDRDGTIIRDTSYIARPESVELLPGAGDAIRRLNTADVPVILVTNQSGIARGLFDDAAYQRVHARLVALLAERGARLDAAYMCPHLPELSGPCDCRKPGTLLFRRAAHEHRLDLTGSWYLGDRWRDVAPAISLGGHGILIAGDATPADERDQAIKAGIVVERSLAGAVARVLAFL